MDLLSKMAACGAEQVVAVNDERTGLRGWIVLHDTTRGPAIGGCRFTTYPDEASALDDAFALAAAMTRKCALAGLNAGGGKGVLIAHDGVRDRSEMFRALARYVDSLSGRFYTSWDLGVRPEDLAQMREITRYVAVPDDTLDLAGAAAAGVLAGMRATTEAAGLGEDPSKLTVAVQGLGAMGWRVAQRLADAGADLWVSDLDPALTARAASELGAKVVASPDAIYDAEADVFSPCATSWVLDDEVAARLKAKAVVGAANNQLAHPGVDHALMARGIRYAPDYAVNAGAVMLGAMSYLEHQTDYVERVEGVAETVTRIFEESDASGDPPGVVADRLADEALVRPKSTEQQWWPIR